MTRNTPAVTRRDLLRVSGVATAGLLAGCTSYDPSDVTYARWQQRRYGRTNSGHNPNAKTPTSAFSIPWRGVADSAVSADATVYSPVVGGDRLYQVIDERLIAYDADEGNLAYEFELPGEVTGTPIARSGRVTVPVGSALVQVTESEGWGSVTPSEQFRLDHHAPISGGITFDGGNFYYQLNDGTLISTAEDGPTRRWSWEDWPVGTAARGNPAIIGTSVVAPTRDGAGVIHDVQEIATSELTTKRVKSRTDHISGYRRDDGRGVPATPLIARGKVVYFVDRAGQLVALSITGAAAQNGNGLRWVYPVEATGAPTLHGDTLIVPTNDGLQARRVSDGLHRKSWDGPFQPSDDLSWNTPTTGSGVAYAATSNGRIYAVSISDGTELGSISSDRPLVGELALSGDNLLATPEPGTGRSNSETSTDGTGTSGSTPTETPASKEPIGDQIFAVTGELNMAYIKALRDDKLDLARAIDRLSVPIEVKASDRKSAIRDEKLVTPTLETIVQSAANGDINLRTASGLLDRIRWAESLTKRTLESVGPTTNVPQSQLDTIDDIPLGEYFAYNTGKLTFRSLLELILFLFNFVKLAKFADEVLELGSRVIDDAASKAGTAKKAGDEAIDTGFQVVDEAAEAGGKKLDEIQSTVDDGWKQIKSGYDNIENAFGDLTNQIKLGAMKQMAPVLEEAKSAIQLQAVGNNKLLRTVWDEYLGRSGKFLWEALSSRKDATVETTLRAFAKSADEVSKAVDRGRALGGYTKGLAKQVENTTSKKADDVGSVARKAQKRLDEETQQLQDLYNRYQSVKGEGLERLSFKVPLEGFENFVENSLKRFLNEQAGDETNDGGNGPNTLTPTPESETPTETEESPPLDELITMAAEAYDTVEDAVIWFTEQFTIGASTTFAFVYQEAIEHGKLFISSSGPLSPLISGGLQQFSLRGALLGAKENLNQKFSDLSRVKGLPDQTKAEEARRQGTDRLNDVIEDVIAPLLNIANLDLWKVGEDYPEVRESMRVELELAIRRGREGEEALRSILEWLVDPIDDLSPLDESTSVGKVAERIMKEADADRVHDLSLAITNRVSMISDSIGSAGVSVSGDDVLMGTLKVLKLGITSVLGIVTVGLGASIGWGSLLTLMKSHYEGVQGIMRAEPHYRLS